MRNGRKKVCQKMVREELWSWKVDNPKNLMTYIPNHLRITQVIYIYIVKGRNLCSTPFVTDFQSEKYTTILLPNTKPSLNPVFQSLVQYWTTLPYGIWSKVLLWSMTRDMVCQLT